MIAIFQCLIRLVFPGGLLFLAAFLLKAPSWGSLLPVAGWVIPFIVLVPTVLLGWRFKRGRPVLAVLLLVAAQAVVWFAANHWPFETAVPEDIALFAVSFLLPLNLIWLAVIPERGLMNRHGLMRLGVVVVQPLLLWILCRFRIGWLLGLMEFLWIDPDILPFAGAPMLATLVAMLVCLIQLFRTRHPLYGGLFWALVFSAWALGVSPMSLKAILLLLGLGGFTIMLSIIEASYQMAFRDELTGLLGRRALNEALASQTGRYTVAMVDVDHFKKFNDRHGHDVGDQVLRMVAAQLGAVRGGTAYRYGGEEFTILFPGKPAEKVMDRLDELRKGIANSPFAIRSKSRPQKKPKTQREPSRGKKKAKITVSIGVAEKSDHGSPEEVVKAADQQLYKAKKAGRNRVSG